jgi:SAM-dependent methyltransferase
MHVDLLEILREPVTGAALRLVDATTSDGEVGSGALVTAAGARYPIVNGIPRFVKSDGYAKSFGDQWNKFRAVQLDSATGRSRSEARFDDETRWTARELAGKWVLDAGCGAGRFAQIAVRRGARLVALDLSSAVEATAKTLKENAAATGGRFDVIQASLLEPPFAKGSFDFAYSLGVIQHTPDPERGIREVVGCVRPGGRFAFAIYGRKPWTKLNSKYLIRPLTRRLPEHTLLRVIETSMPVLFPITDVLFRLPALGTLARFTIPVANYVDNVDFTRDQRYAEAVLDTFDMLAPRYDSPMTASEVEHELRAVAAKSWAFQSRVPVVLRGER